MIISFEGGDCTGKSTQAQKLCDDLCNTGYEAIYLREPGGTALGENIREIIKYAKYPVCNESQMLLVFAARKQLLEEKILPAIAAKKIVILDRFIDSTFVYQGLLKDVKIDQILKLFNSLGDIVYPDITFLFDITDATFIERYTKRAPEDNRVDNYDSMGYKFQLDTNSAFKKLPLFDNIKPDRFIYIDANKSIDEVSNTVYRYVKSRL